MKGFALCFSSLFIVLISFTQQELLPIKNGLDYSTSKKINNSKTNFHTAIQPYNLQQLAINAITLDSSLSNTRIDQSKRNLINGKKSFFISPIGGGYLGFDFLNNKLNYLGSIGLKTQYNFSKKIGIEFNYNYIVTEQEEYIDTSIYSQQVIPSIGRLGLIPSQNNGLNDIQGHISYSPNSYFSFLLGKGNHFWGDGYRSFLISDNSSSYPYLRIESAFWNVKYTNLYSWHQDITTGAAKNKFSASHHLSWNIIEGLNFGLFESVIWSGSDTLINRGFDVNYLNPVVFYRPIEYAQGSNDNSLLGINLKGIIKKTNILYGQLLLDEFLLAELRNNRNWWGNKYAIQLGFKNYELFNSPNLSFLIEHNFARPFTYSHVNSTLSYGHLNQSLAHPLGANFKETILILSYQHNKWNFKEQANFNTFGADTSSVSYGSNIFLSYASRKGEFDHKLLQGEKHRIFYNELSASYTIIEAINLKAFGSVIFRNETTSSNQKSNLFFKIGIATRLWNSYKDF